MELFDICDESGNPTGKTVSRQEAHRNDILHRTAHIWITRRLNGHIQVLLQKRAADKDSFPGCLDTSSAGHITAGSQPLSSAIRELEEELGIHAEEEQLSFAGTFRIHVSDVFHGEPFRDNEVAFMYVYSDPVNIQDLILQKEEVEETVWEDLDRVIQAVIEEDPLYCADLSGLKLLEYYLAAHGEKQ